LLALGEGRSSGGEKNHGDQGPKDAARHLVGSLVEQGEPRK
jgi:hypothetical protein